jgi:PhnB protein
VEVTKTKSNKIMATNLSLNPYLFFTGRCEEAMEFYRKTVGAEQLMIARYKDVPPEAMANQPGPCMDGEKVMHVRLRIGSSTLLMADGPASGKYDGFALSLTVGNPAEAEKVFAGLSVGGKIVMPLSKTFFSPAFGMLTDQFGVQWMIYVEPPGAAH